MRILLQNSLIEPRVIGGAEISTALLARALSARGHHVDLLATTGTRGPLEGFSRRRLPSVSGEVFELPVHGHLDLVGEGAEGAPLLRRGLHHYANIAAPSRRKLVGELIEDRRPEIMHTNTIIGLTGSIWEAAQDSGVRTLHTLRDYHLLCPRTTLLRSSGEECGGGPLPCQIYRRLKKGATSRVDLVTAPSNFVLQRHLQAGHFPGARAEVVHNAGPGAMEPVPIRDLRGPVEVLYLGQLDTHKGVDLLLDLYGTLFEEARADRLRVSFAGAGPMAEEIAAFCARYPQRARFLGFVEGAAKEELLLGAGVLVLPSRWNDNFPRVMLDAARHAMPVLGANRGGIPEIVEDGVSGTIVEPTVEDLRRGLMTYLNDDALREAHGLAGHARANDYTLERQVERFERLYEELLSPSAGAPAGS